MGEEILFETGYAKAQNARHITPASLTFFDLIIVFEVALGIFEVSMTPSMLGVPNKTLG